MTNGHRWMRRAAFALALVVVLVAAGGTWLFFHLNGDIHHSALYLAPGTQSPEAKNSAGQSPMNILVIGSDTRDSAADCAIGGDCGPGANADVEMVVHLSAGRTDATIMSIPRDTVVDVPSCTDPATGHSYPAQAQVQINSSLQNGGPGCTVAAVHALTGIPIDHFMMVDFAGVVSMSDAVGGVDVCVDNNVYDPDSHLKLAKGTHTLKGLAALEFLRTRHGFGDGGDLGRESAQHVFLSALLQKARSAGTLTDPVALYKLADAATKALTVDNGLAGVTNLTSVARQLSDVPSARTTFITMPNVPYPANANWLSPAPDAPAVFRALADDQPLPQSAGASPSASPAAAQGQPQLYLKLPTGRGAAAAGVRPQDFAAPAAAPGASPSADTHPLNGAAPTGCVAVGTEDTTVFGTPVAAYALNPQIPDSAP
ncbi:LCP family protein [Kitasatospora sp. MAA4]|uniref:LCP family protein n=1 Tax=Kitasatospora sp. MAA4 TaxID=3035093 RepID=UPI002476A73A|nr:LCP family protein [Kitasatospora sp. MAA4]